MADVAVEAIPALLEQHPRLQIAVLGKGEAHIEIAFQRLAQTWPDRVGVYIGFDERRAHVLHAGADILLHGSRFEPCGLAQIYAMRYGTLPVASRVGGLADTIVDAAEASGHQTGFQASPPGGFEGATFLRPATGFLFDGDRPQDVIAAATRAIDAFMRPQQWRTLQRNAMARDYGWNHAVAKYVQLYAGLTDARPAKAPLRTRRVPVKGRAVPAVAVAGAERREAQQAQFVARSA
jgi:starch synthase